MKELLNKEKFIETYMTTTRTNRKEDKEFAKQLALLINEAYIKGLYDGKFMS